MQPMLLQALMNVLPGGMEGASSKVLQADGTVDFSSFLQSLLPALEQQMEDLPPEARASLMAEFQREIRQAQTVDEVQGPEAQVLDAMLKASEDRREGEDRDEADTGMTQLLAMLGAQPSLPSEQQEVERTPGASLSLDLAQAEAMSSLPESGREGGASIGPLPMTPLPIMEPRAASPVFTPPGGGAPVAEGMAVGQAPVTISAAMRSAMAAALERKASAAERLEQTGQTLLMTVPAREDEASSRNAEGGLRLEGLAASAARDDTVPMPALQAAELTRFRAQELASLERIPIPVHQPREFAEAVGQRVMLMLGQQMQGARIELNPVDLGPMEIHLQLRGSEANVHFGAAHALTREVIEAALPRLREMLADQGFTQVNVNVGQQQGQNAQGFNGQGGAFGQGGSGPWNSVAEGDAADTAARGIEYPLRVGGVDLFA